MTRQDAAAFAMALSDVAETFDKILTERRTEMYFKALQDLPLATVQRACEAALTQRFFPTPFDLRKLAGHDIEEVADFAWLALLEAFQKGYYGTTLPDDPITHALVRVYWGTADQAREWWRFCHAVDLDKRRVDFIEQYQRYAAKSPVDLPRLPGRPILPRPQIGEGS